MYIGLKQPRGDGERYVTPARAAARETTQVRYVRTRTSAHHFSTAMVHVYWLR